MCISDCNIHYVHVRIIILRLEGKKKRTRLLSARLTWAVLSLEGWKMIKTFCLLVATLLTRLLNQGTADVIEALDPATDPNLMAVLGDASKFPLIYIKPAGYLNSWAVFVSDGQAVANKIAAQYGFTNRGQVSWWLMSFEVFACCCV